jgi:hypothetical protein
MVAAARGFFRDNIFLVAAVSLPLIVVAFFLVSTAIPRWLVPPPAYDLLISATDAYNQTNPRMTVNFNVRDGRVEATFQAVPANTYSARSRLFLFDHTTMNVREIPVELPNNLVLAEGDPPRTIVVDAIAGRQLLTDVQAPDGYQLESRNQRGPGIVGDVFGMNRYDAEASLVNRGRVIPVALPAPYRNVYFSPVYAVGWLVPRTPDGNDGPR